MLRNVSRIGAIWPRTVTVAPRGGAPARAIASSTRVATRPRSSPATFADSVTIRWPLKRSYSPTIVPFSMRATSPSSGCDAPLARDRHDAQIVEVVIRGCGTSHLHLERDAGPRIGPVVRRDEAARRGRGGERPADLIDGDAELAGELAIDVDLDRRIVERLLELQVAQRRNLRELVAQLRRRTRASPRSPGPATATSTGVGAPKFMMRLTMSPGSNENCARRETAREAAAAALPRTSARRIGASGLSATCSTPSCDPPVQRKIVLIGYDDGWTPT